MSGGGHAPPVATEGFEGAVRKFFPHDYQVNRWVNQSIFMMMMMMMMMIAMMMIDSDDGDDQRMNMN